MFEGVRIVVECNTDSELEQLNVLLEAFGLFQERNARYNDLWKEGGTPDSLHHMKSKHARTQASGATDTPEQQLERLDDPLDLINYTVFYILNLRAGRLG